MAGRDEQKRRQRAISDAVKAWRGELADMYQRYTGALGEDASSICDDVINHELGHPDDCDCEGERIRALIG